ncbi:hypothetical protein H6P81_012779 [Aristolochia fimbriata]|uniref:Uncharacterized protein n=1 Tax=Aristolochia fimbriata TaxID=158543 RepID=A0AAV7EFN6_ARIFI|nr:hypothetical protein H6P81_012779 [Aristolochia fimbriata]
MPETVPEEGRFGRRQFPKKGDLAGDSFPHFFSNRAGEISQEFSKRQFIVGKLEEGLSKEVNLQIQGAEIL